MAPANFSIAELCFTRHGANDPPESVRRALADVTIPGMEQVRSILGDKVISVNSGYRSAFVNAAVGGAENSAHLTGYAVDFNCFSYGDPLAVCRRLKEEGDAGRLRFDQIIQEGTWVHISFAPPLRRQVLTRVGKGYRVGL